MVVTAIIDNNSKKTMAINNTTPRALTGLELRLNLELDLIKISIAST
tara:strand:- start:447 stop:587 length:141 start_codon:yes stop_codon:yes gene_type:complete